MRALSGRLGPSYARGLHRHGYAAGSSETADAREHATLWTCVWRQAFAPEP
jgi:hypothetical protein